MHDANGNFALKTVTCDRGEICPGKSEPFVHIRGIIRSKTVLSDVEVIAPASGFLVDGSLTWDSSIKLEWHSEPRGGFRSRGRDQCDTSVGYETVLSSFTS